MVFGIAFSIALGMSLMLTPVCRTTAGRIGLLDRPGGRKRHRSPTPLLGGAAVCVATLSAILISFSIGGHWPDVRSWGTAAAGALAILLVGIWDDARGMRARRKLLFQFLVAGLLVSFGIRIEAVRLPSATLELGILSHPLTVLWIVALTNAWNLIDGLDGLAAGVAVIAASIGGILLLMTGPSVVPIVFFALAGGCAGFLKYNLHPASIFLGDAGSMFIGFVLAVAPLLPDGPSTRALPLASSLPLLIYLEPILDLGAAVVRRTLLYCRVRSIWSIPVAELPRIVGGPDRGHFHHALLRRGLSHPRSVLHIWAFTLSIACLALVPLGRLGSWVLLVITPILALGHLSWLGCLSPTGRRRRREGDFPLRAEVPLPTRQVGAVEKERRAA